MSHAMRTDSLTSPLAMCPSTVCSVLVRDFYRQRSAGLEAEESGGGEPAARLSAGAARPTAAGAAAARSAVSHRDATWRAGFALRVYEVMVRQPKDYAVVSGFAVQPLS